MSFLPFSKKHSKLWHSSVGLSTIIHAGFGLFLATSSLAYISPAQEEVARNNDLNITLDILDAVIVSDDIGNLEDQTEIIEENLSSDSEFNTLDPEPSEIQNALEEETSEEIQSSSISETALLDESEDLSPSDTANIPTIEPEESEKEETEEAPQGASNPDQEPELQTAIEEQLNDLNEELQIDPIEPVEEEVQNPIASDAPQAIQQSALQDTSELAPGTSSTPEDEESQLIDTTVAEPEVAGQETIENTTNPDSVEITTEQTQESRQEDSSDSSIGEIASLGPSANGIVTSAPWARTLAELLRAVRSLPSSQCALFLPRRTADQNIGLSVIGSNDVTMRDLTAEVLSSIEGKVISSQEVIDSRQCAALDAIRQSQSYPASRLGLSIDSTQIRSGESLTARVTGAGGLHVNLLLIDDNGVVQDLARFTTIENNRLAIDAPLARAGVRRATRQILLAIGTSEEIPGFADNIGELAQDAFLKIPSNVLNEMVFGLATIDVQ